VPPPPTDKCCARGNLGLAKFLLLSCFYARAQVYDAFLAFFLRSPVRERENRLFIFRPRELLGFIFGQLKLLAFTQCFTLILSYRGSKSFHAVFECPAQN
jgi:hypothetical protein